MVFSCFRSSMSHFFDGFSSNFFKIRLFAFLDLEIWLAGMVWDGWMSWSGGWDLGFASFDKLFERFLTGWWSFCLWVCLASPWSWFWALMVLVRRSSKTSQKPLKSMIWKLKSFKNLSNPWSSLVHTHGRGCLRSSKIIVFGAFWSLFELFFDLFLDSLFDRLVIILSLGVSCFSRILVLGSDGAGQEVFKTGPILSHFSSHFLVSFWCKNWSKTVSKCALLLPQEFCA